MSQKELAIICVVVLLVPFIIMQTPTCKKMDEELGDKCVRENRWPPLEAEEFDIFIKASFALLKKFMRNLRRLLKRG